jgi:hypothetical protein
MEHQIKLTIDEVAEKLCRQLIAEGFEMSTVDLNWQVDYKAGIFTLAGVVLTIQD